MYAELMALIQKTLLKKGYSIQEIETIKAITRREIGDEFELRDHIEALVFALLSNQRPWKPISDNHDRITEIFHGFDPDYLYNINPELLIAAIRKIRCGNISINSQMYSLKDNIEQFNNIASAYGSVDSFVTSDEPLVIARTLAGGKYKMKQLGIALAMEYLKNVGIDAIKPDLHIRRLFGCNKLALSDKPDATENEVLEIVKQISAETGMRMIEIDNMIWQFCATGYAEICTANPHCDECLVRKRCKYKNE